MLNQNLFGPKIFEKKFDAKFIKPFQAEHFRLKSCYKYSGTHQKVHINLIFCPNHSFWIFTPDINKSTSYRKDVCHHRHILLIQVPEDIYQGIEGKLVN